jgi:MarR family transcriptional regulator for hemolysin
VLRDDDGVGRRLNITAKAYTEWANERMLPAGIGLVPWVLLRHIERAAPPGLSQKDLAAHVGVGGPTIVAHIDRLTADGLVTRTRDRDDRRITRLAITAEGRRRLAVGGEHAHGLEQELRAVLGERRFAGFMSALRTIHTHVSTVSTDEGGRR